jgi:hypothetical protein
MIDTGADRSPPAGDRQRDSRTVTPLSSDGDRNATVVADTSGSRPDDGLANHRVAAYRFGRRHPVVSGGHTGQLFDESRRRR